MSIGFVCQLLMQLKQMVLSSELKLLRFALRPFAAPELSPREK